MHGASRLTAKRQSESAIFLLGYMGSGKTTVGRALSKRLGWRLEDLDHRIEAEAGCSIADIFRDQGEAAFRRVEQTALQNALRELHDIPAIIALGGGTFIQPENFEIITSYGGKTIFLDAPVEELWRRCQEAVERPLRRDRQHFGHLYETRRPEYMKASIRVDTSGKDAETVASEIVQRLGIGDRNSVQRGK
jgi:shikimate kinase